MGNISSSHSTVRRRSAGATDFVPIPAKVVTPDGRLEEFRRRTTAEEVISGHPDCYLCSSDTMVVNSTAPQLAKDYVLQFGQIYFLLPISKSLSPLSLQDLCVLAIKASTAIGNNFPSLPDGCTSPGRAPVRGSSVRVSKPNSSTDLLSCPKLGPLRKIKSLRR